MNKSNKKFYKAFLLSLVIYAGLCSLIVGLWQTSMNSLMALGGILFLIILKVGVIPALLMAFVSIKIKNYLIRQKCGHIKLKWMMYSCLVSIFIPGTTLITIINIFSWSYWPYSPVFQILGSASLICTFLACLMLYKDLYD